MNSESLISTRIGDLLSRSAIERPERRSRILAEAESRFGLGLMILGVFGVAGAGLPLPAEPEWRYLLVDSSLISLAVGVFYNLRAYYRIGILFTRPQNNHDTLRASG